MSEKGGSSNSYYTTQFIKHFENFTIIKFTLYHINILNYRKEIKLSLFLSEKDIASLLSMGEAIQAIEYALEELGENNAQNKTRERVSLSETTLNTMSASLLSYDIAGAKNYTFTTASNTGPVAYFLLFSGKGELLSIMEANELGRIRTGATTGIATKYLAPKKAKNAALLGTGFQAETQLEAMCEVKNLEYINIWSRKNSSLYMFCDKMQPKIKATLKPIENIKETIDKVSIITTSTSSPSPILHGDYIDNGTHINAIGSNRAKERELDKIAIDKASCIIVDSINQAKKESGDLILANNKQKTIWNRTYNLSDLITSKIKGRVHDDEITLFKSNGLAIEDLAVAYLAYNKALKLNIGTAI